MAVVLVALWCRKSLAQHLRSKAGKGRRDIRTCRTGWKAVQLDLETMKAFEAQGGVFLEEADPEEVALRSCVIHGCR